MAELADRIVTGIDHVVLLVADIERSAAWYGDRLGLAVERLAEWRAGETSFVSLRIDAATIIDLSEGEVTGRNVDHIALHVDDGLDLAAFAAERDIEVLRPPRDIFGARGQGLGMYIEDPDGHMIELKQYPTA